uniref:Uncharacterized protein n=1 Tax=Anguilla anguilla TaxID=7936 RepID=A0A0E9WPD1_ANGAN
MITTHLCLKAASRLNDTRTLKFTLQNVPLALVLSSHYHFTFCLFFSCCCKIIIKSDLDPSHFTTFSWWNEKVTFATVYKSIKADQKIQK